MRLHKTNVQHIVYPLGFEHSVQLLVALSCCLHVCTRFSFQSIMLVQSSGIYGISHVGLCC
uniref:Uncharacterized protein n=1 Tax=Arundo donax TaxID=35708 RepID=A0A0A9GK51_ARUDO